MKTIYKYEVPILDDFTLDLPIHADVLSVQVQHGQPFLWALLDTEAPKAPRKFHLAGTGHTIPDDVADTWEFVGTFQMHGGELVFHLFTEGA